MSVITDTATSVPAHSSPLKQSVSRVVWLLVAAFTLATLVLFVVFSQDFLTTNPEMRTAAQAVGLSPEFYAIFHNAIAIFTVLIFDTVALLMFWRKASEKGVLLVSMVLLLFGTAVALSYTPTFYGLADPSVPKSGLMQFLPDMTRIVTSFGWISLGFFVYVFPDGKFNPRWSYIFLLPLMLFVFSYHLPLDSSLNFVNWSAWFGLVAYAAVWLPPMFVQVYRYRHIYTAVQRQQTKWVIFSLLFITPLAIFSNLLPSFAPIFRESGTVGTLVVMVQAFIPLEFTLLPIAIALAIFHYRLWAIDFMINRSLIYGGLVVFLICEFAFTIYVISLLTQGEHGEIAVAVALVIAGALFQPMLRFMRSMVDRKLYRIEIDYRKPRPPAALPVAPVSGSTRVLQETHFGQYRDWVLVGKGGMAEVYQAIHPSLSRPVAIKILPAQFADNADFRRRFEREAKMVAQLQHPNIVRVFDAGEFEGTHYMVMEYIPGKDLGDLLRHRERLPLDEALPILEQIAAALDYAHERGLVHRDIKPSNILMEPLQAGYRAVLTDFGIAKNRAAMTAATGTGGVIGTFDYISPEQIQEVADIDGRADLYSFGVMAYELLTGELPFKHQNVGALLIAHLTHPAPDARDVLPELPRTVAHALRRALSKPRDDRYPTAGEFVAALSAIRNASLVQ